MFYSNKIQELFKAKGRMAKAYKSGFLNKPVSYAISNPDLAIGFWQIQAYFDREIAKAINDEMNSKVII